MKKIFVLYFTLLITNLVSAAEYKDWDNEPSSVRPPTCVSHFSFRLPDLNTYEINDYSADRDKILKRDAEFRADQNYINKVLTKKGYISSDSLPCSTTHSSSACYGVSSYLDISSGWGRNALGERIVMTSISHTERKNGINYGIYHRNKLQLPFFSSNQTKRELLNKLLISIPNCKDLRLIEIRSKCSSSANNCFVDYPEFN